MKDSHSLNYVYGRNAAKSSLECDKVEKLFVSLHLANDPLCAIAKAKNVKVEVCDEGRLTSLAGSDHHQGFVALSKPFSYSSLKEIVDGAKNKKYPLILILDGIEDPQNLGAILRSCDAFGVDGIIIKNRGEVPLNSTVAKVSTGAINYIKVAMVPNLSMAIESLKKEGYWIVASDGSAKQSYDEVDYNSPIALIVGSEGFGISNLVLKHSDFIVKIPMYGHVNSLNASVATAILLSNIIITRK
ncbi:MAG: 23S rRNA (guanosine(2251)-2'-O)-methyltransferase RlmB [Bacilli bacterium]|jgi:23S rRNA (guanosine2251-2'-O)-methyltransferase|nr:23S rRNA (guanosine(2251)-2'-O)-methyltransferase RlmB [Bacilli bacterium]MCH4210537.1 23S rRNA (guanosine(2251)-2'-O)-methyltransferase RlmB [Bacilli bacterium]MCH4228106.1 23S rRNA (guanosine(2251)-2'-O)-methyltransferase RlmB [Bacilli bacterium]MCH4278167.1 23S rRNA (guanosine(2251)-2'-O)-methyltransferase RlmB [Bacilli bacterium]MCI2054588.1 23S rRNA (guanosine(2251)-2'-O)-methyltransferase RlmB [Bacilli bacterium]